MNGLERGVFPQVAEELQLFEQGLALKLEAQLPLIETLSQHIMTGSGKRLRPLLVLLSCKFFNQNKDLSVDLAIAIEYFHTATLLHDDVLDQASLRRGKRSAHLIWGSKASVLIGDFLFTRAFQLLVGVNHAQIIGLLANTSNAMTRGEVLQMAHLNQPSFEGDHYQTIIEYKTALLFSAAAQMGALLANESARRVKYMADYGLYLGQAFQLIDDALDYSGTADEIGKDTGYDFISGKVTLPVIYAYHRSQPRAQALIKHALQAKDPALFAEVKAVIEETKAIDYTYRVAQQAVDQARAALLEFSETPLRQALFNLADFVVSRTF